MKILKKILLAIVALIALFLIIALFVPRNFSVEKEITIARPQAEVFAYVKNISNQNHFSVWNMADPNMKQEQRGTDGNIGFVLYWNGNDDVGEGEQEIRKIENGRIDTELRFKRPFESTANAFIATVPDDTNTTTVTWGMYGTSSYPMNFMNLFCGSIIGKDLDKGLHNLKDVMEKK